MLQFHETVMGKRFFEGTMPALVEEISKLKHSNEQLAQALFEELHKLNENLNPKMERDIVSASRIAYAIGDGWTPILAYHDGPEEFIIVERRVQ